MIEAIQQALAAEARASGNPEEQQRQLKEAAQAFESLFVRILVKRMRDAQLDKGFFGSGTGSSIYEGLFEQHLSEELTRSSPLGIADMLLRQWTGSEQAEDEARDALRELRRQEAGRYYDLARGTIDSLKTQVSPAPADPSIVAPGENPDAGERVRDLMPNAGGEEDVDQSR